MPAISMSHDERTAMHQAVSRYMAHHSTDPALFLGGREVVMILTPLSRLKADRPVPLTRKQAALALTALKNEVSQSHPARPGLETKLAQLAESP